MKIYEMYEYVTAEVADGHFDEAPIDRYELQRWTPAFSLFVSSWLKSVLNIRVCLICAG